jgi:hypothetical protein
VICSHLISYLIGVYTLNFLCQVNFGILSLCFFTGSRKDKKPVESGPLVHLFATPNPMILGYQLIEATFIHLEPCGEAL